VTLELHGTDVLDADDGLAPLLLHQPDVRVRREQKLRTLTGAVEELRAAGYTFVTSADAARAFAR
jgi:hypothetical protein